MMIRRRPEPLARYGIAVGSPILCVVIDQALGLGILHDTPYLLLFLAVLTSAWYGGVGPGLVATVAATAITIYFKTFPGEVAAGGTDDVARVVIFLVGGVFVSMMGAARMTAEREVAARKEELEITLASIGDAVIATDTDGVITFINLVASRLSGWSRSEAVGRELGKTLEIIDESTRESAVNPVEMVLRSGDTIDMSNHTVLVARDRSEIPIEMSAAPIRGESGQLHGVVFVFHDITERRRQDGMRSVLLLALQQERSRINDLVSSVPGVVWEAWGDPSREEQRIDFVSDYVEELLGYSRAEWLATPNFWLTIVHPDDRETAAERARQTFTSRGIGQNRFRWLTRDGRVIWAETHSMVIIGESGKPAGMRGVTMDITVRKQAEESLQRWEQLFQHAGWGVAIIDPDATRLQTVNPAFARMHGYEVEEMVDMPLEHIAAPEHWEELEENVDLVNHLGHHIYESVHVAQDGRRFPVQTDIIIARGDDGSILYRAANFQDITESKRVEQELRTAMQEAEAASQAKDSFLSMLSHELRTPLTPVFTAAHLLSEAPGLSEEDRLLVRMITQSVEQEARLIDDLLELTRINQGRLKLERERVDIHDIVAIALGFCHNDLATREQILTLELEADNSLLEGDAGRLQQVFWNLIRNAVKFTPDRGEIAIRTFNPSAETIRIEVSDNGVGIEPEHLTRIFKPFEQAEKTITRKFGGLGLGLAISSAIIQLHNGTIRAESRGEAHGSTFIIDLPVRRAQSGTAPADGERGIDESEDGLSYSRLRLLVVESSGDTGAAIATLIDHQGYLIYTAPGRTEALDLAAMIPIDIAIIALDGELAGSIELFQELRRRAPLGGIIIGDGEIEAMRRHVRKAGGDEFLQRPVTFHQMQRAIRNVVG